MNGDLKARTYSILELGASGDRLSRAFDWFIISLIVLNVVAVIAQTMPALAAGHQSFLFVFEAVSVAIFTLEYLLRLWSCTAAEPYARPLAGRLRFAASPLALIDLLAILPFYLPFFFVFDLRIIRLLRLLRLLRVLKLGRYSSSIRLLGNIFRSKKEELVITGVALVVALVIASSLIYFFENQVQPDKFSSIPASMWWAVATLTTVGYGDAYPVTALGKVFAGVIAVLGIGLFALPAGILSSGFAEALAQRKAEKCVCPHCGEELEMNKP